MCTNLCTLICNCTSLYVCIYVSIYVHEYICIYVSIHHICVYVYLSHIYKHDNSTNKQIKTYVYNYMYANYTSQKPMDLLIMNSPMFSSL